MLHSFLLAVFSVSLFSLVAVSIDRCWAVCFPVTYHVKSTTTTKLIIVFCWLLGFFFGSLPTLGWSRGSFDNKCDYRIVTDLNNLMLVCAAIAFLSTLLIAVLYLLIYCEILKQVRNEVLILHESLTILKARSSTGKEATRTRRKFFGINETSSRDSSSQYLSYCCWNVHGFVDSWNHRPFYYLNHRQPRVV